MLQTPQRFLWVGSQPYPGPAAMANQDGTITLDLAPERPNDAAEGTWIQTTPAASAEALPPVGRKGL